MAKPDKGHQWQKQADHFQEIINNMQAVLSDPNATQEDKDEANQTIADMQKNLQRLQTKYGVSPAV